MHIEHQQTVLARYKATLDRRRKSLKSVSQPQIYSTAFISPQLELFELDEEEWRRLGSAHRMFIVSLKAHWPINFPYLV